ncbi:unnamed protein product, partial [Porites evermanni]
FTFVPAPPGTTRATASVHRSPPSERFSGLHIATYRPGDHAGSAVGPHECCYRGAKTGNFKLREQLAIELNIWCCSAIRLTIRSATFSRPRFDSWHTGRRSPPAHQLQSPFYRQPSLQQLHRSHNKR